MRAQNGYLASKGVKREDPNKLTGEDVDRIKKMMERVEREDMKRKRKA